MGITIASIVTVIGIGLSIYLMVFYDDNYVKLFYLNIGILLVILVYGVFEGSIKEQKVIKTLGEENIITLNSGAVTKNGSETYKTTGVIVTERNSYIKIVSKDLKRVYFIKVGESTKDIELKSYIMNGTILNIKGRVDGNKIKLNSESIADYFKFNNKRSS